MRNWEFLFSSITAKLENRFFSVSFSVKALRLFLFFFPFFLLLFLFFPRVNQTCCAIVMSRGWLYCLRERSKKKKRKKEVLFFVGYSITQHAYGKVPPHRQWFIVVVACLSLERSFSFLTFPCQVERGVRILKKENVQKKKNYKEKKELWKTTYTKKKKSCIVNRK